MDLLKLNSWVFLEEAGEELILDFLQGNVTQKQRERINRILDDNDDLKKWFLRKKDEVDIQRYLDGELSLEEKESLMRRVENDSELLEFFQLLQDLYKFMKQLVFKETIRTELRNLDLLINGSKKSLS
jgi:tellurite resistance protein